MLESIIIQDHAKAINLLADALSTMLTSASNAGAIQGLVPHLVDGGLTHLQYVDDTVILLQFSLDNLRTARMILSCYEAMFRLKINFEKSEVITVGLSEEQLLAVNTLGCKIGAFPMKYLGMPVSYCKITKAQLKYHYYTKWLLSRLGKAFCPGFPTGTRNSRLKVDL